MAIRQVKLAFFKGLKRTGGFRIIQNSRWREQKLLILAYHGISIEDEHYWDPALYMPQSLFRSRMEALRTSGCNVLPLQNAIERLYARDLPPRSVALTFDDGTRDFLLKATPVLEEYGYPATVYLTTYYAVHRFPVFNVFISYLLWRARERQADFTGIGRGLGPVTLADEAQRAAIWKHLVGYIRDEGLTNTDQMELTRAICERTNIDFDQLYAAGILQIMSPTEVGEAVKRGANVQLHTHRHRTPDDEARFRREIRENREHIEKMCPQSSAPEHFCYPSGVCRPVFIRWLQAEGVRSATTCRSGLASRTDSRFELPRFIDTCNVNALQFEAWLSGAANLLPRRS